MLTREVEVSDAEFGALHVDGEIDFATSREVLDVTVAAVFWSTGDRSGAFFSDLLFDCVLSAAGVDVDWLWWFGNNSIHGVG
jgi:hypothetical protein